MARIGYIADDITGATDLASCIRGAGVDVRLSFGGRAIPPEGDAVVVALKIRSIPADDAIRQAGDAARALRAAGADQLFFKYCSTFDSTPRGNIGPVSDALMDAMGSSQVVHCPAYPANGRTVYRGHLFVGEELLSESPMRHHPLNPMLDSSLPRLLRSQTRRRVEMVGLPAVDAGPETVAERLRYLRMSGEAHHVIVDAVRDTDIGTLGEATTGQAVAAGAAAFGAAFAAAALGRGARPLADTPPQAQVPPGPTAILAGSLSAATQAQVDAFGGGTLLLAVDELIDGAAAVARAVEFASRMNADGPVLIATHRSSLGSHGSPSLSAEAVSARIESTMGRIGRALVDSGVRRLIVAGGETSGAVADALAMDSARLGPDISPGVCWVVDDARQLAVAFKSGNFGGRTFFLDALGVADDTLR